MTEALLHPRNVPEDVLTWQAGAKTVTVHCFTGTAEASGYVADAIAAALHQALDTRGEALWLGCGGGTPKPVYKHLTYAELDWSRIKLVQADERFVVTDDAASNTRMMSEALASVIGSGKMELISLIQDLSDPAACAAKVEAKLKALGHGSAPMFDIALMGMGPDAHYASIFPHHAISSEAYTTDKLVLPVSPAGDPVLPRITLTAPALNHCRRILFYITGQAKLDVLKTASLDADPQTSPIGAFLAQAKAPVDFVWAA